MEDHPTVFTKPYDYGKDVKAFVSEQSKVLYLSNLPSDTTQSELEYWFTQYGGRPVAYWTLKNEATNKGVAGFVVFGTHEEATELLAMNGKALSDCVIEVQPSSTQVLDKASDLLTPFPPSKIGRDLVTGRALRVGFPIFKEEPIVSGVLFQLPVLWQYKNLYIKDGSGGTRDQ